MTINNFDADSYADKLRKDGYRDDAIPDLVEKKKASLQKLESESNDFEYVMKLEEVGKTENHIIVAGIASNGALDWDDEAINLDSLHSAWDDYMKNPVLRYMHGKDARNPDAIGKVIPEFKTEDGITLKTEFRDGKPFIVAKISNAPDVESIRTKIREGVLRGFSIAGRGNKVSEFCGKIGKNINQIFIKRLSEISIVDLPANKEGFFEIVKGCVGDNCSCNINELINDDQNDSNTIIVEDDYQDKHEKMEDINMTDNIEMEMSELKEFVKSTVSEMITDQELVEKVEAGEAAIKEAQDLKARIAELEAKVVKMAEQLKAAPQEAMKAEEIVEEIVIKEESVVDARIEKLEAELKTIKTTPLYKAEQGVEKGEMQMETGTFLGGIIKANYGGN